LLQQQCRKLAKGDWETAVRILLFAILLLGQTVCAAPRQIDDHRWDQVDRIVAIGDLHGDYDSYLTVLKSAGVVDKSGRWIAGQTHLVQTGDIPDRGPDTRRIIAHMARLAKEAASRGGRVHNLLGNHEAMNVYGDLRYAVEGEFAAFADRRSAALRDRYFNAVMAELKRSDPQRHAALPADYRKQWERDHPLGWVEHRSAWDPRWDTQGELFRWAMQTRVAIQLNDLIFVHGGISSAYCGNSLPSLTEKARAALRRGDPEDHGILDDPLGPLWYRGLAGVEPAARIETIDAILAQHGARHIVIGHTTTGGVIWPRLDARVIMIDTGMGAAYGSHIGWLESGADGLVAGYRGGRLPLPVTDDLRSDYLEAVIAMHPGNAALLQRRDALQPGLPEAGAEPGPETAVACDISR
jgi:hypothetical protein